MINSDIWLILFRISLTYNRKDDNHKIKNIPSNGEIIIPQGNEFEDTFSSKKDDEYQIDAVQNILHLFTLIICFYHHGDHIKADKNHNSDVKHLSCHKIKDHTLIFILK